MSNKKKNKMYKHFLKKLISMYNIITVRPYSMNIFMNIYIFRNNEEIIRTYCSCFSFSLRVYRIMTYSAKYHSAE